MARDSTIPHDSSSTSSSTTLPVVNQPAWREVSVFQASYDEYEECPADGMELVRLKRRRPPQPTACTPLLAVHPLGK